MTPARIARIERLLARVDGPFALIPSAATTTGTIILHDANGVAIADLYTAGAPNPCDVLIGQAPQLVAELVREVRRLRDIIGDGVPMAGPPDGG